MRQLSDMSDIRNKGICINCGEYLEHGKSNRDHVPTKALLDRPYPDNLPVVETCRQCNSGFSRDEEYLSALIASVVSGSTDLDTERFPAAAGILNRSVRLRERIDQSRRVQSTLWGESETLWKVESERISRVMLKNARGHVLFELGIPFTSEPSYTGLSPFLRMSAEQIEGFEALPINYIWAEACSRMMQRQASGEDMWVEVQSDVYRYTVIPTEEGTLVRIVLREYLASEMFWANEDI